MRKPVFAICEQQMYKSAYASAQSDQRLDFRCIDIITSLVSISKISRLYLVSVAEQAGLSLTWSQTLKTGFLAHLLKLGYLSVDIVLLLNLVFLNLWFCGHRAFYRSLWFVSVEQIRRVFRDN